MRRWCCILIGVLVIGAAHAGPAADDGPVLRGSNIVVGVIGAPMATLASNVVNHVTSECEWPTHVRKLPKKIQSSLDAQVKALSQQVRESDLCLVALVNLPEHKSEFRAAVFPAKRVALVDVDALRRSQSGPPPDAKVFKRRVVKESMRSLGLLLGLQDCPWPRCCVFRSKNDAELDSKGMDFCPPCQSRVERILEATQKK